MAKNKYAKFQTQEVEADETEESPEIGNSSLTSYESELVSKCKNVLEYKERDILLIEVNNLSGNGCIFEWGTLKHGKSTIEILGKHVPHFISKVATVEDVKNLRILTVQHGRKRQIEIKRLQDALNKVEGFHSNGKPKVELTEEDIETKMQDWDSVHTPIKTFREDFGYTILPIRHMKMIDNKGPAMNDAVANDEKNKSIQVQLAEAQLQAAEDRKIMMKLMEKLLSK